MTRWFRSLVLLVLVAVVLVPGSPTVPPAFAAPQPAPGCSVLTPPDADAIHRAADLYMLARYPASFGGAEVRRVVGDWALVVVIPKVPADRAGLILHRTAPLGWAVVAGPGTAFPPGSLPPDVPAALFATQDDCG